MRDIASGASSEQGTRQLDAMFPAPTQGVFSLLARLRRGAVPLSALHSTDREALSLAMRRREVLLSAMGGVAYAVRARP